MKPLASSCLVFVLTVTLVGCGPGAPPPEPASQYASPSRFTDPGDRAAMLDRVPDQPLDIADVAANLTVHHNLLVHLGLPKEHWPEVVGVWPPKAPDLLAALERSGPGDLTGERRVVERVRGACMMESHLLATMLRHRDIPVRLRAGYFRDVYTNEDHLVAFWEANSRAKGFAAQLLEDDPAKWVEVNHQYTREQVAVNKHVEHWIAEYWDDEAGTWRLLDANKTFLKAMSDIDVGYHLPRRHFEYAWEAWRKMRTDDDFNPDQYAEWPQDGRSHIRAQLLWDFYSLLNHDIAGYDKSEWSADDSTSAERETYAFVKETAYEDLSSDDLAVLDALARLLAHDPDVQRLVAFYRDQPGLHIPTLESDPYSFAHPGH